MKNKKVLMIISIITLISFIIGFSYAYFTTIVTGNDTASSNITTSGSLKLIYNGTDSISLENSQPGSSDTMTFTVTNSGTLPINNYDIYLSKLINTFINNEVVYEVECVSNDMFSCLGKIETPVPITETLSITQSSIAPGTTHTYTLTVTFIDTGLEQDYNQEKELNFTVTINDKIYLPATLIKTTYVYNPIYSTVGHFWDYKTDIKKVTFENTINIPIGAIESWDVTVEQNGKIMAYIIDDGLGTSTYKLIIQSNGKLTANPNSSNLFQGFSKLKTINNLSNFDTINVTNMSNMFAGCSSITSLDMSPLKTRNVITMFSMFLNCSNLENIELSTFETNSVRDASRMFNGCSAMTAIDIFSFNVNSFTNLLVMFEDCSSLTFLDLSSWIVDDFTDMSFMFKNCSALENIILFASENSMLEFAISMFEGCVALLDVNLSNFTMSNVKDISNMFNGCTNLFSINLSSLNSDYVEIIESIFYNCTNLNELDISSLSFSPDLISYAAMFGSVPPGINILVKDNDAKIFIEERLGEDLTSGNVTIA